MNENFVKNYIFFTFYYIFKGTLWEAGKIEQLARAKGINLNILYWKMPHQKYNFYLFLFFNFL